MKRSQRRLASVFTGLVVALAALLSPAAARAERLRDLADVAGARENQLVGYGLVTGLSGTGDDASVPFTAQSVLAMLRRLGLQVDPVQLRLRNVAAVVVTATLPPFSKPGTKIDVTVASIGNARSLSGGVLVQTLLKGADQKTYAVGQGSLTVGGFESKGSTGSSAKQGSTTSARIPEGALVEREVVAQVVEGGALRFELRTPGFGLSARVTAAINQKFPDAATATDGGAVRVAVPAGYEKRVVELIAELEELEVSPVRRARVVINERTGTIVAGGDVRLAPSAVVHGALTIVVKETPQASQPNAAFGAGSTVVVPKSDVMVHEPQNPVAYLNRSPSLADVASALSALGLSTRELTSVLQAMRAAGALEAELVVQ
ncbi:MAG: flagellar basal body P-ring protein FlgI [Labilithrix sp.]|nr:flagellar basal body P-ring protein FlgI [Labilithrix sp.]